MKGVSPLQVFIPHEAATWNGNSASECLCHSFAEVEASICLFVAKSTVFPFIGYSDLFILNGAESHSMRFGRKSLGIAATNYLQPEAPLTRCQVNYVTLTPFRVP